MLTPEIATDKLVARDTEPDTEYAIKIENKSFSWGLKTFDYDDMFDNLYREMRGLTEDDKTEDQKKKEAEKKKKRDEEKKK